MPNAKPETDSVKDTPMMFPTMGAGFIMAANRAWLRGLAEYSREMSKFLSHRLEEDAELHIKLADCEKPTDAFQVCSDFTQTALREYAEEQKRLQSVAASAVVQGLDAAEKEQARAAKST